jgi:hypothetical protein
MTTERARDAETGETDAETESEEAASVDTDDESDGRVGSVEDTTPPAADGEPEENNGTETVPSVDLDLYDLSVRVSGQATDDLDAVEDTARSLMEYLVEQAHALENRPDDRGLS